MNSIRNREPGTNCARTSHPVPQRIGRTLVCITLISGVTAKATHVLCWTHRKQCRGKKRLLQRLREALKQFELLGIIEDLIFGMPLNSDHEAVVRPLQRLDRGIFRIAGGHTQTRADLVRRLVMSRIHLPPSRVRLSCRAESSG